MLFLFWSNALSRVLIEEKRLFPDALKNAMSIDRNAHMPTGEEDE